MPFQSIPMADRFWTKATQTETCWLWTGARDAHGYGLFAIAGRNVRAHRVAYELEHGASPGDLVVRHICDTPACINPAHLILGTQQDNVADRNERGRTAKGERTGFKTHPERYTPRVGELNGRAKLTWHQAEAIRHRYATGAIGQRALAKEYGVSRALIRHIVSGRNWNPADCPDAREWSRS